MNWYYEAAGARQGPISETELDRLIAEGVIKPETLVWREGMANWTPLREARPGAGVTTAAGAAGPLPGTDRCDSCGKYFTPGELIQIGDRRICATCKPAVLQQIQQGGALPTAGSFDRTGPAWEQRAQLGIPKAAWETMKAVLTNPTITFQTMQREGGIGGPLLYNIILGSIGGIAGVLYQLVFHVGTMLPQARGSQGTAAVVIPSTMMIGIAILMPALIALGAFIYAGILHLSLMVCGGAKQPFETTFRVYNYCSGSGTVLQVIPLCGAYVGGIWALVCMCIGMAKAHEINTGRAVLAVFLPTIVCCVLVMGLAAAVVGVVAASHAR